MNDDTLKVLPGSPEHELLRQLAAGSGISVETTGDTAAFLGDDGTQLVVTVAK